MLLALAILLAAQRAPECALWPPPDAGCLATPAEFVHGRRWPDGGAL